MLYFNYAGYLFCAILQENSIKEIKIVSKEKKKNKNFEEMENLLLNMINFNEFREKQKNLYLELLKIPKGKVITYKALGERTGLKPRAVARYLSINRLPVVIPCHRVVMSNLTLGGYSLGVDIKRKILEYEGVGIVKDKILKNFVIFK